ncbi:MAG: biotin transporter BioY [Gemmatimonadota bacterium]
MATLTAVGAFLRLPLPYVPVTLQVPFVGLAGLWLGPWQGAASQLVYLAAGLMGFPVFARGGGPQYVFEPSFGYLAGFAPGALVTGFLARGSAGYLRTLLAVYAGLVAVYGAGLAHLFLVLGRAAEAPVAPEAILQAGLAPLPKDLALGLVTAYLSRHLHRAGARPT